MLSPDKYIIHASMGSDTFRRNLVTKKNSARADVSPWGVHTLER
jgi:hypothetical protein